MKKKKKRTYKVSWDNETFIKIEAESEEELEDILFGACKKIADSFVKEILQEKIQEWPE